MDSKEKVLQVVAAVDNSKFSYAALQWFKQHRLGASAELTLVHVVKKRGEKAREVGQYLLEGFIGFCTEELKFVPRSKLLVTADGKSVGEVIVECVQELRPDVVLIGSRGMGQGSFLGGLKVELMGSTSRSVIRGTRTPVVVVKPPAKTKMDDWELVFTHDNANPQEPHASPAVVIAVDGTSKSLAGFRWILTSGFVSKFYRIVIVHVTKNRPRRASFTALFPETLVEVPPTLAVVAKSHSSQGGDGKSRSASEKEADALGAEAQELVDLYVREASTLGLFKDVTSHVLTKKKKSHTVGGTIGRFSKTIDGVHLVCVSSRGLTHLQRQFTRSVGDRLVRVSNCAVLVFNAPHKPEPPDDSESSDAEGKDDEPPVDKHVDAGEEQEEAPVTVQRRSSVSKFTDFHKKFNSKKKQQE
jgi:nucleotide-binding universal stress UspA family protein